MINKLFREIISVAVAGVCITVLTACNGIFDDIYDEPQKDVVPAKGQLIVDATSWSDWYYIDLKQLQRLTEEGDEEGLQKAQTEHVSYPIPMTLSGDSDGRSGQYLYWFDVFGEGIDHNEFRSYTPCDAQQEPAEWSIAIHRNNVRTNGGAVLKTQYTSIDDQPESSDYFKGQTFAEDEWSQNEVWDSQDQMLLGLVPSQGINVNHVLSSWLTFKFNVPPDYIPDSHVFVLRLKDGTCAALQLQDYLSPAGKKCWLTINYKYPY